MKLLSALLRLFVSSDEPDALIEHVPVNGDDKKKKALAKLRARAELRHGRKLHTDLIKPREAPKSRTLIELEDKAPKKPENVTPINKKENQA